MFSFKPNIEKLKMKKDYMKLGKCLLNKNGEIRLSSAKALLRLLESNYSDRHLINEQFKKVNDENIIALLMSEIKKLNPYVSSRESASLPRLVLHAGGVDELIEFNKCIAKYEYGKDGSWRIIGLNEDISECLIAYSVANEFDIEKLINIIPYVVTQYTRDANSLEKHMLACDDIKLCKNDINAINDQISNLPPNVGGLDNYCKYTLAKILVSKFKEEK